MPGLITEISTLHFIHDKLENVRCKTYLIQTPTNQEHSFLEPLAGYILVHDKILLPKMYSQHLFYHDRAKIPSKSVRQPLLAVLACLEP